MCLYTKMICPIKAKKDIVVYKVFKPAAAEKGGFYTPVMGMHMLPGARYTTYGCMSPKKCRNALALNTVTDGFFHAYTRPTADYYTVRGRFGHFTKHLIVKCIIPKNTLYYKSYDATEICSRSIFVCDVVYSFYF